jgi:L-lactate dehydrogenase complex protein LldE
MVKLHFAELFAGEGAWVERAERLAKKTYELTDFLVTVAGIARVPGGYSGTITYHDSCSGLRELGVKSQPRALLAKMPGVELKEMQDAETCCGFGGTFSVKFGEISAAMAQTKCDRVRESGAGAVVLGDLGCMLNIEGKLRRMGDEQTLVLHVAEVLTWER